MIQNFFELYIICQNTYYSYRLFTFSDNIKAFKLKQIAFNEKSDF